MSQRVSDEVTDRLSSPLMFDSWQNHGQLIHHLLLYSNVMIAIWGEAGIGKTTFSECLVRQLPSDYVLCLIRANALMDDTALGEVLLKRFGLNTLALSDNSSLEAWVAQINQRQIHHVLLIDDAHDLSPKVLLKLYQALASQSEGDCYFHCVLVGGPQLKSSLDQHSSLTSHQVHTHLIRFPKLSSADGRQFLNFKFSSLGIHRLKTLTDEDIERFIQASGGCFDRMVDLARERLVQPRQSAKPTTIISKRAIATLFTCAGVLGLSTYMLEGRDQASRLDTVKPSQLSMPKLANSKSFPSDQPIAKTIVLSSNGTAKGTAKSLSTSEIPDYHQLATIVAKEGITTPVTASADPQFKVAHMPGRPPFAHPPLTQPTNPTVRAIEKLESPSKRVEQHHQQRLQTEQAKLDSQPYTASTPQADGVISSPPQSPAPADGSQSSGTESVGSATPTKPAVSTSDSSQPPEVGASQSSASPPSPANDASSLVSTEAQQRGGGINAMHHTAATRAVPINRYAIQVVASQRYDWIRQLHQQWPKGRVYGFKRGQDRWYILVFGAYENKRQAKQAIAQLPSALRRYSPWVRDTSTLALVL